MEEFYEAELEMLRMGARDIPGGSSLGGRLCAKLLGQEGRCQWGVAVWKGLTACLSHLDCSVAHMLVAVHGLFWTFVMGSTVVHWVIRTLSRLSCPPELIIRGSSGVWPELQASLLSNLQQNWMYAAWVNSSLSLMQHHPIAILELGLANVLQA